MERYRERLRARGNYGLVKKLRRKAPKALEALEVHEAYLPILSLLQSAYLANIFPELTLVSLVSIEQLCDAGWIATFDDKKVVVTKKTEQLFPIPKMMSINYGRYPSLL